MLKQLIIKEFLQIKRDRRMLPIIFFAPVLQLIILGYAANLDVKDIPLIICDFDSTQESRQFVRSIISSGYFKIKENNKSACDLDFIMDTSIADIAIVIPHGFGKSISSGKSSTVQAIINGSDSTVAYIGLSYFQQVALKFSKDIILNRNFLSSQKPIAFIDTQDRILYNPLLKSRFFFVPAIIAFLLMIVTTMLTALAVVREKETGTFQQLAVTPVKGSYIIIGKLIPFALIGTIDILLVTAVAVFWFKIPLIGSFWLLLGLSFIFLITTLGLGLLVSTISSTQQQAMMSVMFFIFMPFIYFSGFIFPIENMPRVAQLFTHIIPLKYFLISIRSIFLKGAGIDSLWDEAISMVLIGVFVLCVAIIRLKKRL